MNNSKSEKVAVIGFANIYLMPYIKRALAVLQSMDIDYDIIYWDRENLNELGDNLYAYKEVIDSSQHVIFKLISFFKYRRFVLKLLKQNDYDKIFVFYTIPAALIRNYLARNYKNNYVFAYTDYTFEKSNIYKNWVTNVVYNSYATTVTSTGFIEYLPKNFQYIVSHNSGNYEDVVNMNKVSSSVINLTYAGMVRDIEHIKKQINAFGNDQRFVMHFHGSGLCVDELKDYTKVNNIKNVIVHGRFNQDEKQKIMEEADIINNSLANDKFQNLAMTNRMYDAVFYTIPQIVTAGSYSEEVVKKYGIGTAINLDDEKCADNVYEWYSKIDRNVMGKNCSLFANEILDDMDKLVKTYRKYLDE